MIYKRENNWHMDVTVAGVRYREALHTTDKREASALAKKRIGEIAQGKGASTNGREFARKPFSQAVEILIQSRKLHVSARTLQIDNERAVPLKRFFGDTTMIRIKAEDIERYQTERRQTVSNRTINMEVGLLRLALKRAKAWASMAEDVRMLPESGEVKGRVLTAENKRILFNAAGSRDEWMVVYCAAVLAASTTCRGVELKNLRWRDVDLGSSEIQIRRSKTAAGHRSIPLNSDARSSLLRLWARAEALGVSDQSHFVFPACEHRKIDGTQHQKSWRTAWRSLVLAAGRLSGDPAAFKGLRFHDLRHQAITELAEAGATDATMMALAGHMSRKMLEHYSHVRMKAKRDALATLESGLMNDSRSRADQSASVN